ncbi:MAG: biotin--[acetyl-CoA-carboxylase] ligase [Bacteroidota bacterium]
MQSITSVHHIGDSFFELSSTDSTNNHALKLIQENLAADGHTFFAHEQLSGKGQHGKQWKSEKSLNIIQSTVLDISFLPATKQFSLIATMAVAVHDFFSKYALHDSYIKWPNDIYWNERKAGGILIESSTPIPQSSIKAWKWAVVGIGLNINQVKFPDNLPNPVSLKQITGKDYDPVILSKELCERMDYWFQRLKKGDFDTILGIYNQYLYKKDCIVKLRKGNIAFDCTVLKVDEQGFLHVSGANTDKFSFGEVNWVI